MTNRPRSPSHCSPTSQADSAAATGLPSAISAPAMPRWALRISSAMTAIIGASSALTATWKPSTDRASAIGVAAQPIAA